MRPTDEDQSSSRRPNLMSSTRRTASEINILAMLDRHEAGKLPQRILRGLRGRSARFWYGAAGVLACGLAGTLAWLAQDSGTSGAVDSALAGAVSPSGRQAGAAIAPLAPEAAPAGSDPVADGAADSLAVAEPEAVSDSPPKGGATIVDLAPAPAAVPVTAPAATAKAAPKPATARPGAATRTPALAHAEARGRRPSQPLKPAPAAVDTDVALISAIIQHASKRQEAEDAAGKP